MDKLSRTRVACESCRRKKIKCSGEQPCSNCLSKKVPIECVFEDKSKFKMDVLKSSGKNRKQMMEDRLSKLEDILLNVVNKIDGIKTGSDRHSIPSIASSNGVSSSNDTESSVTSNTSNSSPQVNQSKFDYEDLVYSQDRGVPSFRQRFFENHSFYSICSTKSMKWINDALPPHQKDYLNYFKKVPLFFFCKQVKFFQKFVDPIDINATNKEKYLIKPFRLEYEYVMALVQLSKHNSEPLDCMISNEELDDLIYQYYFSDKLLSKASLLLLSSVISLSIIIKISYKKLDKNKKYNPILEKYSDEELYEHYDDMITSSILIYQRIGVLSLGFETIRALLMLVASLEASGIIMIEIAYIILSSAIRFAQEFGLHKPLTYTKLDPAKVHLYRRLWELCLHLDIEFCFRHGKQPIINTFDLVSNFNYDMNAMLQLFDVGESSIEHYDERTNIGFLKKEVILNLYNNNKQAEIINYCEYSISKLRFYSYFRLFAGADELQSPEHLEILLQELNQTSLMIIDRLVGEFKPRFYDEVDFHKYIDFHIENVKKTQADEVVLHDGVLNLHFVFFFQLMVTNRVPFLTASTNESPKMQTFRTISNKSARTILHLTLKCKPLVEQAFGFVWMSFYPFAAFLILSSTLMYAPHHNDVKHDINLLVEVSNFMFELAFNDYAEDTVTFSLYNNRFGLQAAIMKFFLQIVIAIVDSKTGQQTPRNQIYDQQMARMSTIAPVIFSKEKPIDFPFVFSEDAQPCFDRSTIDSPSSNPSLANIINKDDTEDKFEEYLNIQMNDFINNQMDSLPNFFIDNNLGF